MREGAVPTWLTDLHARIVLGRRAVLYWLVVVVLAAATAGMLLRTVRAADAAVDRWGPTHRTAVAAGDLPAGHRLTAADVVVVQLPAGARPPSAVADAPVGATLRADVAVGEVLTTGRVGPVDEGAVAAVVPPDHRGVAVERTPSTPPVSVGDRVEIRATTLDEAGAVVGGVAGGGAVVAVTDDVLVVAVPVTDVDGVVEAVAYGEIVIVVVPDREPVSGTR